MKCIAYVPPLIVTSLHTWEHQRVMNIAQDFLEVIGTRVVTRYQQGVQKLNWQYRSVLSMNTVMPNTIQTTFPMPTTVSSITILGQGLEDLCSLDQHSTFISSLTTPSSMTRPDNIMSLRLEVSQLCANLQAAYDEIACLKAVILASEPVQHQTIASRSRDVLSMPCSNRYTGSHDTVLSTPCSNHHVMLASPSSLSPHRQWHLEDDQLLAYSDPVLDVPDVIMKYNLTSHVDDIMNTMENVEGQNWKCVLEALDIDTNLVDKLVDAMQRAKLN